MDTLELTLADALRMAIDSNPTVDAAELGETISHIRASRARLNRFTAQIQTSAGLGGGVYKPWEGDAYSASQASWDAHLVTAVPLYAGGAFDAAIANADLDVQGASVNRHLTERDVVRATYLAYWNVKGIDLQIEAVSEGIAVTKDALEIIQARADAELDAPLDVNRSTVSLYSQQSNLLDAQSQRAAAEQDLLRLLHSDAKHVVLLDQPPDAQSGPIGEVSDGKGRPEITSLEIQRSQAEQDTKAAKSAALPRVYLNGSTGLGSTAYGGSAGTQYGQPLQTDDLRPTLDATGSITFAWDPFDLRRTHDNVEMARLNEQIVDSRLASQHDSIEAEIASNVARVEALRQQAPIVGQQLALARDNLQILQDLYGQGSTTILELFDAQTQFRSARISEASLRVELAVAETELLFSQGNDLVVK